MSKKNRVKKRSDLLDSEEPIWVTAYNKAIPVRKMTSRHIMNCVACLVGAGDSVVPRGYLGGKAKWLKIFRAEMTRRRGD